MSAPAPDYPAAHSMDTEWFAVDAHGRVARFDTGEDGALPLQAAVGLSPGDSSFDASILAVARLANVLAQGDDPCGDRERSPVGGRLVIVVDPPASYRSLPDSLASVEDLIASGEVRVVRSRAPLVLLSAKEVSDERARELAAREGVRWTAPVGEIHDLLWGHRNDGLYHFGHDHGEDPGLYRRESSAPPEPVTVEDLDVSIRHKVASLVLPVDFARDPRVHLADHIEESEAVMWGDLPLRYDEAYLEQQRRQAEARAARAQSSGRRLVVLLVLVVAFLVFVLWVRR